MRGEVREIGPEKMVATKIDKQFLPNGTYHGSARS